ncbi:MAG TPA: DNA polymerase III subunit gamma/tau, partial [Mesorhizobium sp.]
AMAKALSVRVLSRTWQMLLKGIPEVQGSSRPVSAAEMVLIRLAHAADLPTLDEALKTLEGGTFSPAPEPRTNGAPISAAPASFNSLSSSSFNDSGPAPQARMTASGGGAQAMRLVAATPAPEPASFIAPPEPAAAEQPLVPVKSLADIAALADTHRDVAFKVLLKRCVRPVRIEPGRIEVSLTADAPKLLLNDLNSRLRSWTGRNWLVSLSKDEGGQTLAEMESAKRETAFLDARSDPAVAAVLARFPGAKIIDVRIPDSPDAEISETDLPPEPPADDDDN